MSSDLVSVIMPSYNCGSLIGQTIRSVQAQTYPNWELIVVDDRSDDDSYAIVSALKAQDERIRLLRNPANLGAAQSRNFALREARGRWIAFLDSDDLWEPEKLERQLRFMKENGYAFSYTRYTEMDAEGKRTGVLVSGPGKITRAGMFAYCWPGCLTVMYDAEKIGLLQITDIRKNNDYAMWLSVCKKADCYLLPEVLATYRRGRSGSVSTQYLTTMMKWHYTLFRTCEKMNIVRSLWHTGVNLAFGFYKKMRYVRRSN